ncbi:MAG: c-type cytochrome [Campylobacterota bacterium]|nr:c-type cytochrome [Campylobacterota bacterium]
MKKTLSIIAVTALCTTALQAKQPRSPEVIFAKKCAMCHTISRPKSKAEKKTLVAPPLEAAMAGVVITIDALDGPFNDEQMKKESVAFLKKYLMEPAREDTNCEDQVVTKFGMMPSLKGFISPQELDVVVPWVYDKYRPLKVDGKYQKLTKRK